jgi:hypothetical protein
MRIFFSFPGRNMVRNFEVSYTIKLLDEFQLHERT